MFVAFEVDGTADNADVDGLRGLLSTICASGDVVCFCAATLVAEGALCGLCVGPLSLPWADYTIIVKFIVKRQIVNWL